MNKVFFLSIKVIARISWTSWTFWANSQQNVQNKTLENTKYIQIKGLSSYDLFRQFTAAIFCVHTVSEWSGNTFPPLSASTKAKRTTEALFALVLCHGVLVVFFLATWVHRTWSRAIYTRTSQNQSFNKSLPWYLNQASDLRLPLCSQESTRSFRATFVWLMRLRWIRSSRKPFKLQSPAFQSNTGGTMQQRGEKNGSVRAGLMVIKQPYFQRRAYE